MRLVSVSVVPAAFASVALVASVPDVARAQVPAQRNSDVQMFRPAPGPSNFLTTAGARVDGNLALSVGGYLNYSNNAFVNYTADCPNFSDDVGCRPGAVRSVPVRHLATANLLASITLFRRLQLGLDLPLTFASGDIVSTTDFTATDGTQGSFSLADPRLYAKVRLYGAGLRGPAFAVEAFGQFPTGRYIASDAFIGDSTFGLGGRVIGEYRTGVFAIAANAGAFWRPEPQQFLTTHLGSRFQWSLAVAVEPTPRLGFVVEGFGSTDFFDSSQLQNNAIEVDAAARYRIGDVSLTLGAGTGVLRGVGSPAVRALLGVQYAPFRADTDGDGVQDDEDRCPTVAEDHDGFEDRDGCPEDDNDRDGIPDVRDHCPNEPEDLDHFQDEDGCPDRDNDNDGIPDGFDGCPNDPEDRDGDRDEDGCPDDDRDRDGIPDARDRCPNEAEDTDGFEDEDGCPEPDNDHDGILDESDQCAELPETVNGFQDEDGCPDVLPDRDHDGLIDERDRCPDQPEVYDGVADDDGCPERHQRPLITVEGGQVHADEPIEFVADGDAVRPESLPVLDHLAFLLRARPEIPRLDVQAYTDNAGDAASLTALSQRRADAIRTYLVAHGVDGARVLAHGFGPAHPIGDNTHTTGRRRNRRVELHVLGPDPATRVVTPPRDDDGSAQPPATAPTPAPPAAEIPAVETPEGMTFGVDPAAQPSASPARPPAH